MLEDNIGKEIVDALKQKLKDEDLVVTGNLQNSVHYVVGKNQIEIYADEYAKFVDSGTKPHALNEEGRKSIRTWAAIRGVNPWWMIRKIRLYGTEAHPYLDDFKKDIDNIVRSNIDIFIEYQTRKVYQELRDAFNKQK